MFVQEVALVSETTRVKTRELMRVGAALQKQAARDFEPIWSVPATIDVFERLEDVPIGYWPVIIRDDIGFQGAAGTHLDQDGQPFALVQADEPWSLTASHEVLEMLADPFGNRVVAGDSIMPGQGQVEYLVEVCDPSESAEFGYSVNGSLVSDFYCPSFFDPPAVAGVRYSFVGAIKGPRQVLSGGYLSWHNPVDDHWYQARFFGPKLTFHDLGKFDDESSAMSLREWVDQRSYDARRAYTGSAVTIQKTAVQAARDRGQLYAKSTRSRARRWRSYTKKLLGRRQQAQGARKGSGR